MRYAFANQNQLTYGYRVQAERNLRHQLQYTRGGAVVLTNTRLRASVRYMPTEIATTPHHDRHRRDRAKPHAAYHPVAWTSASTQRVERTVSCVYEGDFAGRPAGDRRYAAYYQKASATLSTRQRRDQRLHPHGDWYGNAYGEWSAMFATSGVYARSPTTICPSGDALPYEEAGLLFIDAEDEYVPEAAT
jgi:hypothetical protein